MKRMAVFLFFLLGAIGCDDSVTPKEQLEGNWLFQAPDGFTGMGSRSMAPSTAPS